MSLTPAELLCLTTAQQGFMAFQQGLSTGEWQPWLDLLTEDFVFQFPVGAFREPTVGKEKAAAFFQQAAQKFPDGLTLTVQRQLHANNTVLFEVISNGIVQGQPYHNLAAISLDIDGDHICGYREYLAVIYQFG